MTASTNNRRRNAARPWRVVAYCGTYDVRCKDRETAEVDAYTMHGVMFHWEHRPNGRGMMWVRV